MIFRISLSFFLVFMFPLISVEREFQNPISQFLFLSKDRYQQTLADPQNSEKIHFILGNESADLDSIVSSIAYAYLLHGEQALNQDELYIPLLNICKEEIALRKDVLYLFELFGISLIDLLFLDDNVPLNVLNIQDRLRLNLVDHNALRPRQQHLSNAVERIIDHHVDENKKYPLLTQSDKKIAIVGSNSTLISEIFFSSNQMVVFPELAGILLGPILIDTLNLESIEKTTNRDMSAALLLENLASNVLPLDYYKSLLAAKNDISDLTPEMLLSKDFKEYLDGNILYGISSLPNTVTWNVEDLKWLYPVIKEYALKRNLKFFILLIPCNDIQFKRKVIVYAPSIELLNAFEAYIENDEKLKDFFSLEHSSQEQLICFYGSEKAIARKHLQPLLKFSENLKIQNAFKEFDK